MHIRLRADRRANYWLLNIVMPLFIVTSCLFASFAVRPEHFADRCSITVTLLLAQVSCQEGWRGHSGQARSPEATVGWRHVGRSSR